MASPLHRHAITFTIAGISLIRHLGKKYSEILSEIKKNEIQNVVWKVAAIFPRLKCVDMK